MRNPFFIIAFIFIPFSITAQELYVYSEPASNMATGSIGIRLNSKLFMVHNGKYENYRLEPEIMFGVSRKIMLHVTGYGSNMLQKNFRVEGGSVYGKYRFYSQDEVHEHFRLAAFAKIAVIKNPQYYNNNRATSYTGW